MKSTGAGLSGDTNRRGIVLMIAAMANLAVADSLVKVASKSLSSAQVLFFLVSGALVLYASIAVLKGENLLDRRVFTPVLLLRYLAEVTGMIGMVTALALVPISTVGAITQATPLLAALGAVFFLNEQIGWRRWTCIVCGFIGVLLIVKPSQTGFDLSVLWAILALMGLAVRDLTTRMAPADMPSSSLSTFTMAAATLFTLCWVFVRGEPLIPSDTNWIVVAPMIVLGAIGYLLLVESLRTTDVSVVMPFRFSRVLFLLVMGVLVFDERPDGFMLIGAVIIVVSGAYMLRREGRLRNNFSEQSIEPVNKKWKTWLHHGSRLKNWSI